MQTTQAMYKLVLTLISILLSAAVFAQDSTHQTSSADSAIKVSVVQHGKYSTLLYTINGMPQTQSTLESHLMSYAPAAQELQEYKTIRRNKNTGGLICASVSIGALIAARIQANQAKVNNGPNFNSAPVFLSISIAGLAGEIAFLCRRNRHFDNAIQAYNSRF
jgi:hypothetical protein